MGIKDFFFGLAETALEMVPGGKAVKRMTKGLARAVGMGKDLFAGGGGNNFSEFANTFNTYKQGIDKGMGSLKEGLDSVRSDLEGVKSDIQTQGRELRQAMGEMKSELEEQINQQAERERQEKEEEIRKLAEEAELAERKERETKQQQEQMRIIAQRQEEIDRRRRQNIMSLDLIHEQAMDYVLGYFPSENDFYAAIQTNASWDYNYAQNTFYTVKEWFYKGARIDISKFIGVEHSVKDRNQKANPNALWVYWAGR